MWFFTITDDYLFEYYAIACVLLGDVIIKTAHCLYLFFRSLSVCHDPPFWLPFRGSSFHRWLCDTPPEFIYWFAKEFRCFAWIRDTVVTRGTTNMLVPTPISPHLGSRISSDAWRRFFSFFFIFAPLVPWCKRTRNESGVGRGISGEMDQAIFPSSPSLFSQYFFSHVHPLAKGLWYDIPFNIKAPSWFESPALPRCLGTAHCLRVWKSLNNSDRGEEVT